MYRPVYYLLDEQFYQLQDKVSNKLKQIEEIFKERPQLENFNQYLDELKANNNEQELSVLTDLELPGLTQDEIKTYKEYLAQNCPLLGQKQLSRKEFQNIVSSLTDDNFEEKQVENHIRRVIYEWEYSRYSTILKEFTNDPELQQEYSFGLLPPSRRYMIQPPQEFKQLDEPDYHTAFNVFAQTTQIEGITFDMYETYCKTLFAVCTEEDFYQKIMRAISKRNSIINKY